MRLSLLLIGTAYLSLGLGSAQACSVKFQCSSDRGPPASPCRFALLWPGADYDNGRFFMVFGDSALQENIPPNAKYCSGWDSNEPLWSNWESNCAKRIWPDGKCSRDEKVITQND
jgi:hypothetical protein